MRTYLEVYWKFTIEEKTVFGKFSSLISIFWKSHKFFCKSLKPKFDSSMISNRSRSSKCNCLTSNNNKTGHPNVDNSQLAINKCVSALFFVRLEVPSVLHYSAGVIKETRRTTSLYMFWCELVSLTFASSSVLQQRKSCPSAQRWPGQIRWSPLQGDDLTRNQSKVKHDTSA